MSIRRTKIVCTMGPSLESADTMRQVIGAGMDVARFNFSHGDHSTHARWIDTLTHAARECGRNIALMADTKGPEIRLGRFRTGSVLLEEGARFVLSLEPVLGDENAVWVQYDGIVDDVQPGMQVLVDDGNICLQVESVTTTEVVTKVISGGVVTDGKKVNLPGAIVSLPSISPKDVADIRFAVERGFDFIAASFVRKPSDVLDIRRVIEEAGGDMHIIAKIENKEGVENLDEILKVSDGLMVARGDLGVEIPAEEVPLLQKSMIKKSMRLGKPVITATQMLESMVTRPRPTRAEASDVANAILDGSCAVMLSAETAIGKYPVEAVQIMARIAERTELSLRPVDFLEDSTDGSRSVTDAVSHATCSTARELGAAAIICATQSGHTSRMVAKSRPSATIIAATPDERVKRKLALVWGVTPVKIEPTTRSDMLFERAIGAARASGLVSEGELVVLTAGIPVGVPGTTNMLTVQTIGSAVLRGIGMGTEPVSAKANLIKKSSDAPKFRAGDILVTTATHPGMMGLIERAVAVVTEEGGLTSHAARACLSLGIPVIVGAAGATTRLEDGALITVDPARGLVYLGSVRV